MKLILIFCTIFFFNSCIEKMETSDLIIEFTSDKSEVLSDGQSQILLVIKLNNNLTKRNVIFETNGGIFKTNNSNKILISAEKENDQLVAKTILIAPTKPGIILINAEVEIENQKGNYVVSKEVTAIGSPPKSIELKANSFSVFNNFDGEVELTGLLKNEIGGNVSEGYMIELEDFDINFEKINGVFRNQNLSSNSKSEVSAIYTPGNIEPNQYIFLVSSILDESGKRTSTSDTLKLFVKKNE